MKHNIFTTLALTVLMVACGRPSVPGSYTSKNNTPNIFPDYTDVTIPCNIAPLNFAVQDGCKETVARFTYPGGEYIYGDGTKVIIDEGEWKEMLNASKGKNIKVDIFSNINGEWIAYKSFNINVAEEEIDPYISYRLIQPSYVAYEGLSINQRNITTYEEKDIYNNMSVSTEENGQCINCHSYQNFKTSHMLFHMRQSYGGTMIVNGDEVKKVDLKTDELISAGVYPAWHPTLNIIAFSTNKTGQSFHTKDIAKIEVQDTESDLILYDVDKNEVSYIAADENELEIFPTWSPDGKTLYFGSAHFVYTGHAPSQDSTQIDTTKIEKETEMIQRYKECKYDLYKKSFDPNTRTFGPKELVYSATEHNMSATLPRISADGRYLAFAEGGWGCFHIWHPEADIQILDLKTGKKIDTKPMNSPRAESYPVWSSNGRWIMCESRRDDGNYTRPAIAYFDKQGKVHKAFELPQKDPYFYTFFLRSFNRPEFMVEPVKVSPQTFSSVAKKDAKKAVFKK
ncbi:MAG: hypothetical protein K6E54_03460 [Bacteroidaceae bacterium]|nr:hypothetical protein [Bacteroidaceae bacterium]